MKEDLLHMVWKMKKFDFGDLRTTKDEPISIINFGNHNHDSGPDFLNAEINIGHTKWFGHVEIHVKASEWTQHKHQHDPNYNNVILHVVFDDDKAVFTSNGLTIPTLELKGRIDLSTLQNYDKLKASLSWVPCAKQLHAIDSQKTNLYLETILIQRLQSKTERVFSLLETSQNDWENVLFKLLSKYLGLKVNNDAFAQLTEIVPHKLIHKVSNNLLKTEALLFGQAGLLPKKTDAYIDSLIKEYDFLKHKFELSPMNGLQWKFSRMRPVNFPSVRLAQMAALYHKSPQLFNAIVHTNSIDDIHQLLKVAASEYWDTHYIPGKKSKSSVKNLGDQTKQSLLINAVIPLIFAYGIKTNNQNKKDYALSLLDCIPAEKNKIIRSWKTHGITADSARQSQALIELKTNLCDQFRCLNCNIGKAILFS